MTTRGSMDGRPAAIRRVARGRGRGRRRVPVPSRPVPVPVRARTRVFRERLLIAVRRGLSSPGSGKGGGWSEGDAARPRTTSVGACSVPHHSPGLPSIARSWRGVGLVELGVSVAGRWRRERDGVGALKRERIARGRRGQERATPRASGARSRATRLLADGAGLPAACAPGRGRRSGERATSSGQVRRARGTPARRTRRAPAAAGIRRSRSWPNPRGVSSRSSSKTCAKALDPLGGHRPDMAPNPARNRTTRVVVRARTPSRPRAARGDDAREARARSTPAAEGSS